MRRLVRVYCSPARPGAGALHRRCAPPVPHSRAGHHPKRAGRDIDRVEQFRKVRLFAKSEIPRNSWPMEVRTDDQCLALCLGRGYRQVNGGCALPYRCLRARHQHSLNDAIRHRKLQVDVEPSVRFGSWRGRRQQRGQAGADLSTLEIGGSSTLELRLDHVCHIRDGPEQRNTHRRDVIWRVDLRIHPVTHDGSSHTHHETEKQAERDVARLVRFVRFCRRESGSENLRKSNF